MGKRSDFEKRPKDMYLTPREAVIPLVPFLPSKRFRFAEPCAGDGRLVDHLEELTNGVCDFISDIDPEGVIEMLADEGKLPYRDDVRERDIFDIDPAELVDYDAVITNPPWTRDKKSGYLLHKIIEHLVKSQTSVWLLFDADWMQTVQAAELLRSYCVQIVSVGRVKWIEDSKMTGKDNCCWYEFRYDAPTMGARAPLFWGRYKNMAG